MSDEAPGHPAPEPSGEAAWRERLPRTNLLMSATIETEDMNVAVRIRNLSETGALLEGAALPKVGARLVLRRLQLEIGGTVVWSANARCGVAFEGTISVAGWRSGNWIAPIGGAADQLRVDSIQAAVRAGSPVVDAGRSRPEWISDQVDADIDVRIAEELDALRRLLENLGDQLSEEALVVERYPRALQSFDLACQILGHLGHVLTARNRSMAVDAIGMEELRHRLKRKAAGPIPAKDS